MAGGTDVIVQVREHRRDVDVLVDIKKIPEVMALKYDPKTGLEIGSAVPCCEIYENKEIAQAYPGLIDAAFLIGGIQIQSRASLGGNLCNSSPAADSIPALIALGAVCVIAGPKGNREVPSRNSAPRGATSLEPGEMLVKLKFPTPKTHSGAAYLRFIPRNEMDIAVVGAGVSVELDSSRTKCTQARIALGAVADTILVSDACMALVDGALTEEHLAKAVAAARAAAKPISDMRGTAEFRKHIVGVLVKRALEIALERAKG